MQRSGLAVQPTDVSDGSDRVERGVELDEFYRSRRGWAVGLGHLLTGSREIGEELAQDAFLALQLNWSTVDRPDAYLRGTLVNLARSHVRRRVLERRHSSMTVGEVVLPAEIDETWQAIRRLGVKDRTVLVLRYYEDLSVPEIAAVLAVPEGTVKARLHRALKKLEGRLR
jgi:RNA polymerase sigma factor (sigma-70 family)